MTVQASSANRWIWITVAILVFFIIVSRFWSGDQAGDGLSLGPKVGVVNLNGPIFDSRTVIEDLEEMAERGDVKAIVFRVNSPGGAVAPSQEIRSEERRVGKECRSRWSPYH